MENARVQPQGEVFYRAYNDYLTRNYTYNPGAGTIIDGVGQAGNAYTWGQVARTTEPMWRAEGAQAPMPAFDWRVGLDAYLGVPRIPLALDLETTQAAQDPPNQGNLNDLAMDYFVEEEEGWDDEP